MKKLTFIESAMLVAGAGMGTGVLTIPYCASRLGLAGMLIALALSYVVSFLLYMYIAELTLRSDNPTQLPEILRQHLFKGRFAKLYSGIFFTVFVIIVVMNLILYIMCATDIFSQLFSLPPVLSKVIFYLLSSFVLIFGIKGIGIGEKLAVPCITAVILFLTGVAFFNIKTPLSFGVGSPTLVLALFSLFMFAFSAIFSVVQVANSIEDKKKLKAALVLGLTINAVLTLIFAIAVTVGSQRVTEVATVGLTEALGSTFIKIVCAAFVLLAMLTSYWSSGLAFADALQGELKMGKRTAWLLSTLPTLILSLILPLSVMDYVQIGAGALSFVVVIIILPAYYNSVKSAMPEMLPPRIAKSKTLLFIVGFLTVVMAVCSLIPIGD